MPEQVDPKILAEMREEEERKAIEAENAAEAEAKKTPEEKLFEARKNVRIAGQRFCARILGQLARETGKLVDQYSTALTGREKEVTETLWEEFLSELDVAVEERKVQK